MEFAVLAKVLLRGPWGAVAYCVLVISDRVLTMWSARLYQAGAKDIFPVEGSLEITPLWQRDVDSLRMISPRFVVVFVLLATYMTVLYLFGRQSLQWQSLRWFYEFMLGMLICLQLAVHMRHLNTLYLFRAAIAGRVRGRLEYNRSTLLRRSSVDLFAFSGLFLFLFGFTQSWFTAGGALGCFVIALKHLILARKAGLRARAQGA